MTGSAWFAAGFITVAYGLLKALARTRLLNDPTPRGEAPPSTALDHEGCFICRPDDPAAAEEGCAECDARYWANPIGVIVDPDGDACPSDPDGQHHVGCGCDALTEWSC